MSFSRLATMLLFAGLLACTVRDSLTAEELSQYVADPDNRLLVQQDAGDVRMTVYYRPTDLLVHQEMESNVADKPRMASVYQKYSPFYYFVLNLSRENKELLVPGNTNSEYGDLLQVLSFRMNEFVNLTTADQDTIPVGDFMLNRTYGMGRSTELLFAFNKEKSGGSDWVQFNLREFGLNTGNQRFRFRVKDLEDTPRMMIGRE